MVLERQHAPIHVVRPIPRKGSIHVGLGCTARRLVLQEKVLLILDDVLGLGRFREVLAGLQASRVEFGGESRPRHCKRL